ncbi:cytochrome b [Clarias magur]|uniref:Cytochrome b n=1 Tax=Clarias magur TaxID=1594786 RepID=A0A8J4UES9_CLAMG|nr:cytochrome b [Clarias magur]
MDTILSFDSTMNITLQSDFTMGIALSFDSAIDISPPLTPSWTSRPLRIQHGHYFHLCLFHGQQLSFGSYSFPLDIVPLISYVEPVALPCSSTENIVQYLLPALLRWFLHVEKTLSWLSRKHSDSIP